MRLKNSDIEKMISTKRILTKGWRIFDVYFLGFGFACIGLYMVFDCFYREANSLGIGIAFFCLGLAIFFYQWLVALRLKYIYFINNEQAKRELIQNFENCLGLEIIEHIDNYWLFKYKGDLLRTNSEITIILIENGFLINVIDEARRWDFKTRQRKVIGILKKLIR